MSILELLYLMLPAYFANMAPVFVRRIPWNAPMDFGFSLGGIRLFGANKTWKGFVAGIVLALMAGLAMAVVYWPFAFSPLLWSLLAGSGALIGDVIKSFFKRRVGIKPGAPWIPFDQLDYSVGALALGSFVFFPGWLNAVFIVIISVFGHIVINQVGYYLGIRDVKW